MLKPSRPSVCPLSHAAGTDRAHVDTTTGEGHVSLAIVGRSNAGAGARHAAIFHKLDDTIRGHVLCSFLALVLRKALEDRVAALGRIFSWPDIVADLESLTEIEIEQDGKRFLVRPAPRREASLALQATGVALPLTVRSANAA